MLTLLDYFNERHTPIGLPGQKKSDTTKHLLADLGGFDEKKTEEPTHRQVTMRSSGLAFFEEGIVRTRREQATLLHSDRISELFDEENPAERRALTQ